MTLSRKYFHVKAYETGYDISLMDCNLPSIIISSWEILTSETFGLGTRLSRFYRDDLYRSRLLTFEPRKINTMEEYKALFKTISIPLPLSIEDIYKKLDEILLFENEKNSDANPATKKKFANYFNDWIAGWFKNKI